MKSIRNIAFSALLTIGAFATITYTSCNTDECEDLECLNGGTCIANPNGEWLIEPVLHKEGLIIETLDFNRVLEERQNFDPVGHYSRPDVTKLTVNRDRQSTVEFNE